MNTTAARSVHSPSHVYSGMLSRNSGLLSPLKYPIFVVKLTNFGGGGVEKVIIRNPRKSKKKTTK